MQLCDCRHAFTFTNSNPVRFLPYELIGKNESAAMVGVVELSMVLKCVCLWCTAGVKLYMELKGGSDWTLGWLNVYKYTLKKMWSTLSLTVTHSVLSSFVLVLCLWITPLVFHFRLVVLLHFRCQMSRTWMHFSSVGLGVNGRTIRLLYVKQGKKYVQHSGI